MADDTIPSPNDAPYVPTSEGMPSLPAAPGDFSETPARDPTNPWVPLTSARAATERQRLNFEEGKQATARGAIHLLDLQRIASGEKRPAPTEFDPQYVPGSEGMPSYEAPQLPDDEIQNNARKELEQLRADSIAYAAMPTFRNPVEFGMSLTGQAAAALTSPENYWNLAIRPFTTAWRLANPVRADIISFGLGQGAIQTVVDPIAQAAQKEAGLRVEYDPVQTAMAGGGGLLLGGGFGVAPHAWQAIKNFELYPGAKTLAEKIAPKVPPELKPAVEPRAQRPAGATDFLEQYGPNYQRLQAQLEEHEPAPGYVRLFRAEKPGEKTEGGRVEFTTNPAKAVVEAGPGGNVTFLDLHRSLAASSRNGDAVSVAESVAKRRQPVGEPPSPDAIPDPDAPRAPIAPTPDAAAPPKAEPPLSFTQFVRSQGGLKPSPELTAIYGKTNLNVIRKKGLTLDQMRERAVEAGYLPRAAEGMPEDSGAINRVLEMLSNEEKKIETHVPAGRESDVVRPDLKRQEAESEIINAMQDMEIDPRARENKDLFERAVDEFYRSDPEQVHPQDAVHSALRQLDEIGAREGHYTRPTEAEIPFFEHREPARKAGAGAAEGEPRGTWAGELPREVRGGPAEEIAQRAIGTETFGVEPRSAPARQMPTGQQARLIQNLSDVMRSVTQKLEATVLKGEVERGATGTYNVATHIARIKESTNHGFLTWVHEVLGHHVEVTNGKPLQNYLNTPQNLEILRALSGPFADEIPPKQLMSEGFARFMEAYITNRPKIEDLAPSFVRDFREIMSKSSPETLAALDEAHAGWQTYFNAPSVEVGMSHIISSWSIPTPKSADLLGRNAFGKAVDLSYQYFINQQHPMTLLKRAIAEAHKEKYGSLIDIPADKDFERFAQLFSHGTHGAAFSDLRDGFLNEKTMTREQGSWYSIRRRIGADAVTGADGNETEVALRNQQYAAFAVAQRQLQLRELENQGKRHFERGIITPYTDGQARQIVSDTLAQYPHFQDIADEIAAWNKQRIQKDYDHHIITKDEYDFYMHEDNKYYVPLNRDMRDLAQVIRRKGLDDGIEDVKRFALGGSDRNILDPLDEFERMVFQSHQQISENRIFHSIRDAIRQVGGPEGAAIGEEVSAKKIVARSLDIEQSIVEKVLEHGLLMEDAKVLAREVLDQMGPKTRATLFSKETKLGETLVFGKENGVLKAIRLNDGELAKGVVNVIDAMGPMGGRLYNDGLAFALNVVAKPAEVLRLGVTTTGTYVVKNLVRDAVSHPALTSESKVPFANALKSARNWFQEKRAGELSDVSKNYTYFGGLRGGESFGRYQAGTILEIGSKEKYGFSARVMQNTANKIAEEAGIEGVPKGRLAIVDGWSKVLNWSEFSERGPRKGLFETVYKARIKEGWTEAAATWDAAYKANDILAFGRYGSAMAEVSRILPFVRSGISGIDKFRRMWLGGKNAPGVISHYTGYGPALTVQQLAEIQSMKVNTLAVSMAAATISYGLYLLNKDDPHIASLTDEQRANNWVTRLPGTDKYLFIPKGFETGSIFNFAERTIELIATGDPKFAQKFLGSLGYSFNLPGVSQIPLFGPAMSLAANYDYYFDKPIVPDSKKGLAPHEQTSDYINPLSKYIANVLAENTDSTYWHKTLKEMKLPLIGQGVGGILASPFSPMESQFLIERLLGGWPREIGGPIGVATALHRGETPDYLGAAPGLRALVKDLYMAGEPMREVYNHISQNEARLSIALRTYKYNIDNGQPEKATAYLNSLDSVSREYVELKINPAGNLGLHPLERANMLARTVNSLKTGINSDQGIASISDPSVRIVVDRVHRRELVNTLTQLEGFEAQNSLIIQKIPGWSQRPLIDTQPLLEIIKGISPEFYNEFTGRLAQNRVLPTDAIAKAWPEVQRILKTSAGVDPRETAGEIKAIAADAYSGGTLGGGSREGTRSFDVQGQRVKRAKKTYGIPERVSP